MRSRSSLVVALAIVSTLHAQLSPPDEQAKLQIPGSGTGFGESVSASGDTLIVGADGVGAAYVYVQVGQSWSPQATLVPPDQTSPEGFGYSVGVSGDTVVVGASGNEGKGAAYVFTRTGSSWDFQAKLTAADATLGQGFGMAVAIAGETT